MKCLIVKVRTPVVNLKVDVFVHMPLALRTLWATFQVKNNVRSAPASTALAQILHKSYNVRTVKIVTYKAVEKGMENKGKLW